MGSSIGLGGGKRVRLVHCVAKKERDKKEDEDEDDDACSTILSTSLTRNIIIIAGPEIGNSHSHVVYWCSCSVHYQVQVQKAYSARCG